MITIYKPTDVQLTVVDGDPPVDQSAEVAALQVQVSALTAARDAALSQVQALSAKIDAAKAALA